MYAIVVCCYRSRLSRELLWNHSVDAKPPAAPRGAVGGFHALRARAKGVAGIEGLTPPSIAPVGCPRGLLCNGVKPAGVVAHGLACGVQPTPTDVGVALQLGPLSPRLSPTATVGDERAAESDESESGVVGIGGPRSR